MTYLQYPLEDSVTQFMLSSMRCHSVQSSESHLRQLGLLAFKDLHNMPKSNNIIACVRIWTKNRPQLGLERLLNMAFSPKKSLFHTYIALICLKTYHILISCVVQDKQIMMTWSLYEKKDMKSFTVYCNIYLIQKVLSDEVKWYKQRKVDKIWTPLFDF